jgi:hypothetical protein
VTTVDERTVKRQREDIPEAAAQVAWRRTYDRPYDPRDMACQVFAGVFHTGWQAALKAPTTILGEHDLELLYEAHARVCAYHEEGTADGGQCDVCLEGIRFHLDRGETPAQLLADMAFYAADYEHWLAARTSEAAHELATTWRGLQGPFKCDACGANVIYDSGGPEQTLDGARKLCRTCVQVRVDEAWADKPDGVYAIHFTDHQGNILATALVRKGPKPMTGPTCYVSVIDGHVRVYVPDSDDTDFTTIDGRFLGLSDHVEPWGVDETDMDRADRSLNGLGWQRSSGWLRDGDGWTCTVLPKADG